MNTLEFLRAILPEDGVHYIALFKKDQKFPAHLAFATLEKMAAKIIELDAKPQYAVYHACASYKENYYEENGKKRYRKQPNWNRAKALWIDVDCGEAKAAEGKGYVDKLAAAKAIYGFCNKTSFPRPMVIDSGNGIHCYWPFTRSVSPAAWQMLANKLHDCFMHFGIRVDPSRTADFASVLRPVGSTNRKGDPKPVTVRKEIDPITPEDIRDFLSNVVKTYNVPARDSATGKPAVPNINDDLVSTPPKVDSSAAEAANHCQQIAFMRDTKGDVNYEHWRGVIGVIKHCTEGIALAREWSEQRAATGHAQNDVLTRYTTWEAGPTTCEFFSKNNPGGCDGCAYKGKVKSPIMLGRIVPEPEATTVETLIDGTSTSVEVPPFPKGYEWTDGAMVRHVKDKDGIWHPHTFTHSLFYLIHRERKEDNSFAVGVRTHRPDRTTLDFSLDTSHVASNMDLMKVLAGSGEITVSNHKDAAMHMSAYVRDNLEQLKSKANEINTLTSYGWKEQGDGTQAFLIGDRLYKSDGSMTKVLVGGYAADFLSHFPQPRGSLASYAMAVNKVYSAANMEPLQYAFCSGFGSILTPFSDESLYKGLLLAIYGGDTAKGKTTVCYAAQLAFGDAQKMMIQGNKGSTVSAQYAQMGAYGSIPMLYDEFGNIDSEEFSDFAYRIASGQERARMTTAGGSGVRKATQTEWRMSPYLTGNKDFHAILAHFNQNSQAEAVRLIQIAIDRYDIPQYPEGEVAIWVRQMERNSGVAGAAFVQWVVTHQSEMVARLAEWNAKVVPYISGPKYRFYRAHATATLTAASIMQDLGIIDFDLDRMFLFSMGLMKQLCESVTETNMLTAEDALNIMVNDFQPNILNTHEYRDVRHRDGPEMPPRVYGAIAGRYVLGDNKGKEPFGGMLFISRQMMKDWCVKRRIELDKVIEHAKQKNIFVADAARFNLTRGTMLAAITLRCIQLDTNKMDKPVSDGLKIVATMPRAVASDPPPAVAQPIRGAPPAA
jgi:hypothetical protein